MTGIDKFQATHSGNGLAKLLVENQRTVAAAKQPEGHCLAQAGPGVDDRRRLTRRRCKLRVDLNQISAAEFSCTQYNNNRRPNTPRRTPHVSQM
ncbi:hypothetical protein ABH995_000926 [Bradyrhizobium yuanmingense]|uniref:hypothetical protein n=1 Tax=Bradyrhizobium yuanmingense TaxID=108015 RepID=UPI0035148C41